MGTGSMNARLSNLSAIVGEPNPIETPERAAWRLASRVHANGVYSEGVPYIVHLALVAGYFKTEKLRVIAILHEVLNESRPSESAGVSSELFAFGKEVYDAVIAITRRRGEQYLYDYVERVCSNQDAWTVMMACLDVNVYHAEFVFPESSHLIGRYRKAMAYMQTHNPYGIDYGESVFPMD